MSMSNSDIDPVISSFNGSMKMIGEFDLQKSGGWGAGRMSISVVVAISGDVEGIEIEAWMVAVGRKQ